jgi:hypothetical protein
LFLETGTMTVRHGSEEAVEKVRADAKVGIHEAVGPYFTPKRR